MNTELIYIAHPYGGDEENKKSVETIIKKLIDTPYVYISPIHSFGFLYHDVDYKKGLDMCLNLLSKCNALVLCGDWQNSKGCVAEYSFAKGNNIPIYESLDDYVKTIK